MLVGSTHTHGENGVWPERKKCMKVNLIIAIKSYIVNMYICIYIKIDNTNRIAVQNMVLIQYIQFVTTLEIIKCLKQIKQILGCASNISIKYQGAIWYIYNKNKFNFICIEEILYKKHPSNDRIPGIPVIVYNKRFKFFSNPVAAITDTSGPFWTHLWHHYLTVRL